MFLVPEPVLHTSTSSLIHSIFCMQLELITRITGFYLDKYLQNENIEVWGKKNPETDFMQRTSYRIVYNRLYKSQPTLIWRKGRQGYSPQQNNPDRMVMGGQVLTSEIFHGASGVLVMPFLALGPA